MLMTGEWWNGIHDGLKNRWATPVRVRVPPCLPYILRGISKADFRVHTPAVVGSSPAPATKSGYSSTVEYELPKLQIRVRFPLSAPIYSERKRWYVVSIGKCNMVCHFPLWYCKPCQTGQWRGFSHHRIAVYRQCNNTFYYYGMFWKCTVGFYADVSCGYDFNGCCGSKPFETRKIRGKWNIGLKDIFLRVEI